MKQQNQLVDHEFIHYSNTSSQKSIAQQVREVQIRQYSQNIRNQQNKQQLLENRLKAQLDFEKSQTQFRQQQLTKNSLFLKRSLSSPAKTDRFDEIVQLMGQQLKDQRIEKIIMDLRDELRNHCKVIQQDQDQIQQLMKQTSQSSPIQMVSNQQDIQLTLQTIMQVQNQILQQNKSISQQMQAINSKLVQISETQNIQIDKEESTNTYIRDLEISIAKLVDYHNDGSTQLDVQSLVFQLDTITQKLQFLNTDKKQIHEWVKNDLYKAVQTIQKDLYDSAHESRSFIQEKLKHVQNLISFPSFMSNQNQQQKNKQKNKNKICTHFLKGICKFGSGCFKNHQYQGNINN